MQAMKTVTLDAHTELSQMVAISPGTTRAQPHVHHCTQPLARTHLHLGPAVEARAIAPVALGHDNSRSRSCVSRSSPGPAEDRCNACARQVRVRVFERTSGAGQ